MKNIVLCLFFLFLLSSCLRKEIGLDDSTNQQSIMIQHQYEQVGFDSPEIFYSSDSNYVLVKNYKEKLDSNLSSVNFFILKLASNQIIYQKKIQNGDVSWVNNDEIKIKKLSSNNNDESNEFLEYLINFKTKKKTKIK